MLQFTESKEVVKRDVQDRPSIMEHGRPIQVIGTILLESSKMVEISPGRNLGEPLSKSSIAPRAKYLLPIEPTIEKDPQLHCLGKAVQLGRGQEDRLGLT